MRLIHLIMLGCVALLAQLANAQPAMHWTVESKTPMDVRLRQQLRELATANDAGLRFVPSDAPGLVIELVNVRKIADFAATLAQNAPQAAVRPNDTLAREGYLLRASYTGNGRLAHIRITAATAAGFHMALLRVPDLLHTPQAQVEATLIPKPQALHGSDPHEISIADYPAFPIRGIVEGFYGAPWTHQDRLDMLRFEGQHGLNIYFYGPKDDLYQRQLWRTPYPAPQMRRLADLAAYAKRNFVDFSFAVSPGLSIAYSSEADFRTLTAKYNSVRRLGITNFAIFLDDVPQDLVHAEDRQRFKTLAQAHIYLVNRLNRYFKSFSPEIRLTVCPTTYTNQWGSRAYIAQLGAGIDPGISIDWTGPTVGGSPISKPQAREWGGYLHRKPLVWENFPNDDDTPWLPVFDYLQGMDPDLPTVVEGMFSNPLNQAHAAMISIQTMSDYLWNPRGYDPDRSQDHAVTSQYGQEGLATLAPLIAIYREDGPARTLFPTLFGEQEAPIDVPAIENQIAALRSILEELHSRPRYGKLAAELAPIPAQLQDQLQKVKADPNFSHLPDGRLQRNTAHDALHAYRIEQGPLLDGDFAKWRIGPHLSMNTRQQLRDDNTLWHGPTQFSADVALRWDETAVYVGVHVVDPDIYQSFTGRGIDKADAIRLMIDTAVPRSTIMDRSPDVYDLYLSPGNFKSIPAGIYCNQDMFPQRPHPRNYEHEIHAVWKKTADGYSGDIVIPARFLGRRALDPADRLTMSVEIQKGIPHGDPVLNDPDQIIFTSKRDPLFPVTSENPNSIQTVLLEGVSALQH